VTIRDGSQLADAFIKQSFTTVDDKKRKKLVDVYWTDKVYCLSNGGLCIRTELVTYYSKIHVKKVPLNLNMVCLSSCYVLEIILGLDT